MKSVSQAAGYVTALHSDVDLLHVLLVYLLMNALSFLPYNNFP